MEPLLTKVTSLKYWFSIKLLDGRFGYEGLNNINFDTDDRFAKTLYGSNVKSIDFESSILNPTMKGKVLFSDSENQQMINTYNNI